MANKLTARDGLLGFVLGIENTYTKLTKRHTRSCERRLGFRFLTMRDVGHMTVEKEKCGDCDVIRELKYVHIESPLSFH